MRALVSKAACIAEGRELALDLFREYRKVNTTIWEVALCHSLAWDIKIDWELLDPEDRGPFQKYLWKRLKPLVGLISSVAHEDLSPEFLDYFSQED